MLLKLESLEGKCGLWRDVVDRGFPGVSDGKDSACSEGDLSRGVRLLFCDFFLIPKRTELADSSNYLCTQNRTKPNKP